MIHVPTRSGRWPEVVTEAPAEPARTEAAAGVEEPAPREYDPAKSTDRWTGRSTAAEYEDVAAASFEMLDEHRGRKVVRFRVVDPGSGWLAKK